MGIDTLVMVFILESVSLNLNWPVFPADVNGRAVMYDMASLCLVCRTNFAALLRSALYASCLQAGDEVFLAADEDY